VLHTIGSHWYYNNHFSEKYELFKPITTSRIITQNSSEQIINSYDNTIVYTDFFLDQLIAQLENKNALIIYISDHGEVLGENGAWLHAGDNAASKKPACFVWFSDNFAESYPEKINALKTNKDKYYRTDMIFHSILDGGTIQSPIIDRKLNIFN
jgi:glucan phosphoethanolaminetransferase (alkaline phosphatase superfamily)